MQKLQWLQQELEESGETSVNRYRCHYNLGTVAHRRGQLPEAARHFRLSTEQAADLKHLSQVNSGNYSQAKVLVEIGKLDEVKSLLEEMLDNIQVEDHVEIMARSLLGVILAQMGQFIEACQTLAKAHFRHQELDIPFREANFMARAET